MDVSGKKAIIFGGTSGIGLAAAKQLAAAGCNVIAVSRNPDKAGEVPPGITLKQCDVLDREAMAALFRECAPFDIATRLPRSEAPTGETVGRSEVPAHVRIHCRWMAEQPWRRRASHRRLRTRRVTTKTGRGRMMMSLVETVTGRQWMKTQ